MLKTLWSLEFVDKQIEKFVNDRRDDVVDVFKFQGESFLNDYRDTGSYIDQTGNLRASGGYFVKNGNETLESGLGDTATGKAAAIETMNQVPIEKDELALIGVAGMEYADSVESRGRDVITPMAQRAAKELELFLKELAK